MVWGQGSWYSGVSGPSSRTYVAPADMSTLISMRPIAGRTGRAYGASNSITSVLTFLMLGGEERRD
jgi:hypothetical protein